MEIAEEDEEEQPTKRQSLIKDGNGEEGDPQAPKTTEPAQPVKLDSELAALPEHSKFSAAGTSEVPNFVGAAEEASAAGDGRRLSSQSGRDIHTSYSSFSTYSKPKVKIGPRPSLDTNPRPQTAGNFRPVSSIPAGFKLFGKGSTKKSTSPSLSRKDSVGSIGSPSSEISEITFATTIPIPEESGEKENLGVQRPATSSGVSTKSTTTMNSKHGMTPEKARLKKAMQLREKKRKMAANKQAVPPLPSDQTPADEGLIDDEKTEADAVTRSPVVQADSGIGMDTSAKDDQASELTVSDSRPTSPVVASSEAAQSTKASSISESTDQTSRAVNEEADKPDGVDETTEEEPASSGVDDITSSEKREPDAVADKQALQTEIPAISEPPSTEGDLTEPLVAAGATAVDKTPAAEIDAVTLEDAPSPNTVQNTSVQASNTAVSIPALADQHAEDAVKVEGDKTTTIPATPLAVDADPSPESKDSQTLRVPTPSSAPQESVDISTTSDEVLTKPLPSQLSQVESAAKADEPVDEQDSDTDTIPARPSTEPTTRRKPPRIDPIRVDLANRSRPTSQSEINFSDSESLLEELQSATVQEAKPMIVSKTPVTPVFPGKPPAMSSPGGQNSSTAAKPLMVRTVSNPVRGNLARLPSDVSQSSARSVSQGGAAYLHKITQQRTGDNGLGKKTNVGSSISQRIKALELLSVNSAETASQPGSRPSSTFFSVKKDRVPSRSPSVVERTNSFTRDLRPTTAQSKGDSPESTIRLSRERSGSISSRLSMFEPADSPGYQPRGRPETISVTARIMRESPSTSRNATDRSPLELKQSFLSIDHQRADTGDVSGGEQVSPGCHIGHSREPSKDSVSRRSSFTIVKDFIKEGRKSITSPSTDNLAAPGSAGGSRSPAHPPPSHQNNSFSRRLSIGSRRSLSRDRGSISPSVVTEGSGSGDETKSNSDKKKSRTSRLMRRLSSLSGSNRNKTSSPVVGTPTVTEEEWPETKAPVSQDSAGVAVDLGDVNVQFPDTLLWKRRNMYLDTQGFVTLSAAAQQPAAKAAGVKRYHLSEFKTPYCPDVEVQELPNSVVLDFLEGSAIQVACEDRSGQMRVLNGEFFYSHSTSSRSSDANTSIVLQEAYSVHGAKFGQ
jgi:hypothetical protein